MRTTKEQIKFAEDFTAKLGKFVGKEKAKAKEQGISGVEFNAIATTAFKILGRHAEAWKRKAKIK